MNTLEQSSFLDMLKPTSRWKVDAALLSSYSLDPVVAAAALLALSGGEDEGASGTRVALARALTQLHGRVAIVVQRGRIQLPRRRSPLVALLDRFLVEVPWDEQQRSWHPKVALVRFVPADGDAQPARWRLWVGSRNLTRDASWDAALTLESCTGSEGERLPGLDVLADNLARHAGPAARALWSPWAVALAQTRWTLPPGLVVEELTLHVAARGTVRALPLPPRDTDEIYAVSPFIDATSLKELSGWPARRRMLLTTLPQLQRCGAAVLSGLEAYVLPHAHAEEALSPDGDEERALEERLATAEQRGLHAKMLYFRNASAATLWLGSANLTQRGWRSNAEAVVRLRLTGAAAEHVRNGLTELFEASRAAKAKELEGEWASSEDADALDVARREVAARWNTLQATDGKRRGSIRSLSPVHPTDPRVHLAVGALTDPALQWVDWPRGASVIVLPDPPVRSDLVRVRVTLGDEAATWVQVSPHVPPLPPERELDAMRHVLGPRGLLEWLQQVLTDTAEGDGGGDWQQAEGNSSARHAGASFGLTAPTIEGVLRLWLKRPEGLREMTRVLAAAEGLGEAKASDPEALAALRRFQSSWHVIVPQLEGFSRGR